MGISFNEVPSSLRTPLVAIEFDNTYASQGASSQSLTALVIGQSSNILPEKPVLVSGFSVAKNLFGESSMLAMMAEIFFMNNSFSKAYFLPVKDNPAGVKAKGGVTIQSPALSAGVLTLYIGGVRVQVAIPVGLSNEAIAILVSTKINQLKNLPVSAEIDGSNSAKVNLTCHWNGETGNSIDIRTTYYTGDSIPAGLTLALTPMAGGAGNPDISAALSSLGSDVYNVIAFPYSDAFNLAVLKAELKDRSTALRQIDSFAYFGFPGNYAELSTFGASLNTEFFSVMGAYRSPSPPYLWACALAAAAAFYASIDPAMPFQTIELKGILAPDGPDRFTMSEQNNLLYDGISTFTVDSDLTVRIQRLISTYRKNPAGANDSSYLDMCTLFTLSFLRADLRNLFRTKYPRSKLANDGKTYPPSAKIVTPSVAKGEIIARYKEWMELGLVENIESFKEGLIVERNSSDPNRLDTFLTPDLMNQLMVQGVKIGFLL